MFRRWVDNHFKLVRAFLLILAGLNLLVSYTLFPNHPIMAAANATMAILMSKREGAAATLTACGAMVVEVDAALRWLTRLPVNLTHEASLRGPVPHRLDKER